MTFTNPPDAQLRDILVGSKTIAIVGASSNTERTSHTIMAQLLRAGYHVIPVNPKETEILGQKAYASLADIPEKVDIVDVFRKSEDTPPVADEAVAIGAKVLWLQLGVTSDDAAARATQGGLTVIMDKCIGATHHALHVGHKPDAS